MTPGKGPRATPGAGRARMSPRERRAAQRARAALARGTVIVERRFVAELRGIASGISAAFVRYLAPAMHATVRGDAKKIGIPDHVAGASGSPRRDVDTILRSIIPQIGPKVSAAHARMSAGVERAYASSMTGVLPIGWERIPSNVQAIAGQARDASIKLVEDAARSYAAQVREVFDDPKWTQGSRWEDLRDALLERGGVSESRAELIARDQTLKLNGAINQAHQRSVGVEAYVWSTSGDERVRDSHADLDGQTFAWNAPPEPGHPGEDFQCRCVALPIIADLAEFDVENPMIF